MSELTIKKSFKFFVTLISGMLFMSTAHAYRVNPMIAEIEPTGSGSSLRIMVTNTENAPINLELTALRVTTDDEGEVSREEEVNDILLFPPQTIIPPGREQAVQVRYVGDQELEEGRVYAIRISQLPVAVSKGEGKTGSEVKIGFNFLSHILVQSKGMQAGVKISEVSKTSTGELKFYAENTGQATALIRDAEWTLTDESGKSVLVDKEDLDTGSFGALISGAPKRMLKIKADAVKDLSGPIEISTQIK